MRFRVGAESLEMANQKLHLLNPDDNGLQATEISVKASAYRTVLSTRRIEDLGNGHRQCVSVDLAQDR